MFVLLVLNAYKTMLKKIIYILLLLTGHNISGQNIDSLINELKTAKDDTSKVNTFLELGKTYAMWGSYDTSKNYINNAILLSTNISYKRGLAKSYNFLGLVLCEIGDFEGARGNFELAIQIRKKINNKSDVIASIMNLGMVYDFQGNFSKALENYFIALNYYENNGDKNSCANTLNNIALVYFTQEDFKKSLETHLRANELYFKLKDKEGLSQSYNNIGNVFLMMNKYNDALVNYQKSLSLKEELKNFRGIAITYDNLGSVYKQIKNFELALKYYFLSLNLFEKIGDEVGLAGIYNHIGIVYLYQAKIAESDKFLNKALHFASKTGSVEHIKLSYEALTSLDSLRGNYKGAYFNHFKYIEYRDSIFNQENTKKIVQQQMQYEFDKKTIADSVKVAEEKKVVFAQLKQEKTQRFALYGGLVLVGLFGVFMFNRFRVTQKQKHIIELKEKETLAQKHIIEEKHKEITDSINYAERIQKSFLATTEQLNQNLKEFFILFKPKDVVSGDFYWSATLNNELYALATADSTGHGVPGAIMSLLNITSLEKAIETETTPDKILNLTRKTIIERLKKDGSPEGGKDGMDCSLLVFDFKNLKLQIAAANNPVWIVRSSVAGALEANDNTFKNFNSTFSIYEVKPDKMPVGKHDKQDVPFTLHEIDIQKGDLVYTLTDGFPDQFGGEKGKKYMIKNLRELIISIAHLPMHEQKQILEQTFNNWKGTNEQVDDVTVVGIKI